MTAPQIVTNRYVHNLIYKGSNREFTIVEVTRNQQLVDGLGLGYYYQTKIRSVATNMEFFRAGATIFQAARRTLETHGVTFR